MKSYNMILTEKQQKYQHYYLKKLNNITGEEILPSEQRRVIEQANFTYSPLGKALEKQIKTTEDPGLKQFETLKSLKPEENYEVESIEGLFPKKLRNIEIKNEIDDIKKFEDNKIFW